MKVTHGFTLIETLAATALAVMLVVSVVLVSQETDRGLESTELPRENQARTERLWRLFEQDLQHARGIQTGDNRLVLGGYAWIDPATMQVHHDPCIITYEVVDQALWRKQERLGGITTDETSRELVVAGLSQFEVEVTDALSGTADRGAPADAAPKSSLPRASLLNDTTSNGAGEDETIELKTPPPDAFSLMGDLDELPVRLSVRLELMTGEAHESIDHTFNTGY